MNDALRVLPVLLSPKRLLRSETLLMTAAFAATAALVLTVTAGTWAFFHWDALDASFTGFYRMLAIIATVLLAVPAFTLGQATMTLAARRHDEQLSTLSLLGAGRSTITVLAVAEPLIAAAVGTVVGIGVHYLLLIPTSLLPFQGAGLGYQRMLLPWWMLLLVAVLLLIVSLVAVFMGLRKVSVSPLGVRTRSLTHGFPWLRIAGVVGVLVLTGLALAMFKLATSAIIFYGAALAVLAMGLVVIDLLGVLIVRLLARMKAKRAQTPAKLVAARMVGAAPKQYWRRVSGLSMTAFIAVFGGAGVAIMNAAQRSIDELPEGAASPAEEYMAGDIFTGVLLTLGIAFTFIVISAVLNQAADIYDRASTYRELHAAGMSELTVRELNVKAVMMPVVWVSAISAGLGLILGLPLVGGAIILDPLTFLVIAVTVVIGALLVRVGLMVTNPLLRTVTAQA